MINSMSQNRVSSDVGMSGTNPSVAQFIDPINSTGADLNYHANTFAELASVVKFTCSIFFGRVDRLNAESRDIFYEMMKLWFATTDRAERKQIESAIEEMLDNRPVPATPVPRSALEGDLKSWATQVGENIRKIRKSNGWSQIELAEKADIPQSHISRLENAEHSATRHTLEKLAKALSCRVCDLDPDSDL